LRGIASFYNLPVAQVYNTSFTGRIQAYRSPTGRPEIPGSLLIGEERMYWRGEKARWQHGRELTPADFLLTQYLLWRSKHLAHSSVSFARMN
jgi:hypothetical protein